MGEWRAILIQDEPGDLVKSCPWSWRVANTIMTIFFSLAAYVQVNDPDPIIWMMVYGIPSILCAAVVLYFPIQGHFLWKALTTSHMVACVVGALYLSSFVSKNFENGSLNPLDHEEGRELCGILIVIIWLAICKLMNLTSWKEMHSYLWMAAVAVSVLPFVMWGFYLKNWDTDSLPSHCKNMIVS